MSIVTDLPSGRTSYVTVKPAARHFAIELVTPGCGGDLKSTLASAPDLKTAFAEAERIASGMKLPFKPATGSPPQQ